MDLVESLRAGGPVSPAVQIRKLLTFCKIRGWEFDVAWRWMFERIKMPHDTSHRREWRTIIGATPDDMHPTAVQHREVWRRAYENHATSSSERSVAVLVSER